jgi:hypothetical protein
MCLMAPRDPACNQAWEQSCTIEQGGKSLGTGRYRPALIVSRVFSGPSDLSFGGHAAMSAVERGPKGNDWLNLPVRNVNFAACS